MPDTDDVPNLSPDQMRSLAAELLRAQRVNDRTAFDRAMLQAEGQVPELLISLCGLANRAMNRAIGRDAATALVANIAAHMDEPPPRDLFADEIWADALRLLEAVGDDDGDRASAVMRGVPDLLMLHGFFVQAVAQILANIDPGVRASWLQELRAMPPPSL